jgi:hypothetical protein
MVKNKSQDRLPTITRLALCCCLIACLAACERPITVALDGKNPPTFKFDGHGELQSISLYELTASGKLPPRGSELWEIRPLGPLKTGSSPSITYGIVPPGFTQIKPSSGDPLPLKEGHTYGFGATTTNVPGTDIWFTVHNGQTTRVRKTDGVPDGDL